MKAVLVLAFVKHAVDLHIQVIAPGYAETYIGMSMTLVIGIALRGLGLAYEQKTKKTGC